MNYAMAYFHFSLIGPGYHIVVEYPDTNLIPERSPGIQALENISYDQLREDMED